jgi:hypothetical protein
MQLKAVQERNAKAAAGTGAYDKLAAVAESKNYSAAHAKSDVMPYYKGC